MTCWLAQVEATQREWRDSSEFSVICLRLMKNKMDSVL
jgi:hypothetical protein